MIAPDLLLQMSANGLPQKIIGGYKTSIVYAFVHSSKLLDQEDILNVAGASIEDALTIEC